MTESRRLIGFWDAFVFPGLVIGVLNAHARGGDWRRKTPPGERRSGRSHLVGICCEQVTDWLKRKTNATLFASCSVHRIPE